MIKIKSFAILNCTVEKIFEILIRPEVSREIFPEVISIERKVPDIPTYEGEKYKITILLNGKELEEIFHTKKVEPNRAVEADSDGKYSLSKSISHVEDISGKAKLIIQYEIIFKSKGLVLLEGFLAKHVSKAIKKNLETIYKHIDSSYVMNSSMFEAKVWGVNVKAAYFLNMASIAAISFCVAFVRSYFFKK